MADDFKLPPVITASTWPNAFWATFDRLRQLRGVASSHRSEAIAPKMTNREAVAIVSAIRALAPMTERGFGLWYQYAALAYGWDPDRDRLTLTQAQSEKLYDQEAAPELMLAFQKLAGELDLLQREDPRVELDRGAFDDRILQGEVIKALRDDGAEAVAVIPQCRDKKSGKVRTPRPPCDPNDADGTARRKRKVLEPNTRQIIEIDCDAPGDCKPLDPVGGIRKLEKYAVIALLIGGALYLFAPAALSGVIAGRVARQPRRGRRRRY